MNKSYIPHAIIFSGIAISAAVIHHWDIGLLEKIASIIGSLSLGVALAAYLYTRRQDNTIAAVEQVSFFRSEIMSDWESLIKIIKQRNPKYPFPRISFEEGSIPVFRKNFSHNFDMQASVFMNSLSGLPEGKDMWDGEMLNTIVQLLNKMEELSLRIFNFHTEKHEALESIHNTYSEIIEQNAVALFFVRDVINDKTIYYSSALALYRLWKEDNSPRMKIFNRLEKNGFITKKQKEEMYDVKRKKNEPSGT